MDQIVEMLLCLDFRIQIVEGLGKVEQFKGYFNILVQVALDNSSENEFGEALVEFPIDVSIALF